MSWGWSNERGVELEMRSLSSQRVFEKGFQKKEMGSKKENVQVEWMKEKDDWRVIEMKKGKMFEREDDRTG